MLSINQYGLADAAATPPILARPIPINFFRVGDVIPPNTFDGQGDAIGAANDDVEVRITEENIGDFNNNTQWDFLAGSPGWPAAVRPAVNLVFARDPVFGLVPSEDYMPGDADGLTRIRMTSMSTILPDDPTTGLPTGYPVREPGMTNEAYMALLEAWVETQTDTEEVGLPGFSVADNGDISVILGNRKVIIGRLALGMFSNPSGLEKTGNSLYRETASSGPVVVTEAFEDGAGKIDGGGLEMSNVDVANEFTDMIVTQRGFQANSRIITVSDTMLEELVNLKR
jgi:flagellar hook protein FlgE